MEALRLTFEGRHAAKKSLTPHSWRGFRVEQVLLESDEPYGFQSDGDMHYLALHDLVLDDGELKINGLPPILQRDLRGTVTYTPEGCPLEGWAKPSARRNAFTAFNFDPGAMRDDLGERYARTSPKPFAYAREPSLTTTMSKLRGLALAAEPDPLYAEALCLAAAMETLGVEQNDRHALSHGQIDRLRDYIEAHLDAPLALDELAGVIGLSRSYLSRSFKSSTGIGLHRFVNNLRIGKAKEILTGHPELPLDSVAEMVGFSSSAVFRRVFQQTAGSLPRAYRASLVQMKSAKARHLE